MIVMFLRSLSPFHTDKRTTVWALRNKAVEVGEFLGRETLSSRVLISWNKDEKCDGTARLTKLNYLVEKKNKDVQLRSTL